MRHLLGMSIMAAVKRHTKHAKSEVSELEGLIANQRVPNMVAPGKVCSCKEERSRQGRVPLASFANAKWAAILCIHPAQ